MGELDQLITDIPLNGVGWAGLALTVVLLIAKGQLVPKSSQTTLLNLHLDQLRAARQTAADWQSAYSQERELRVKQGAQLDQMLEGQRLQLEGQKATRALIESLREKADRARASEGERD